MPFTEKELIAKKQEIEDAKQVIAESKGEMKALIQQLKDTYKCSTLAEAKKVLMKLQKSVETLTSDIEEAKELLQETYFNEED